MRIPHPLTITRIAAMLLDRRRVAAAVQRLAIAAGIICLSHTAWSQAGQQPVDLNIVAHQDDDLLFMNPDILNAVMAGHRQVTVYLTAGNLAPNDNDYAILRRQGAMAAYSKLLRLATQIPSGMFNQFPNTMSPADSRVGESCDPYAAQLLEDPSSITWTQTTLNGTTILVATASLPNTTPSQPTITLVFLNLNSGTVQDGHPVADGYANLSSLYRGTGPTQILTPAQDGTAYTRDQLLNQLVSIFQIYSPSVVRTLDSANPYSVDYTAPNGACNPGDTPSWLGSSAACTCSHSDPKLDVPNYCGPAGAQAQLTANVNPGLPPGLTPALGLPAWAATPASDPGGAYGFLYDHSDHYWSARFAHDALRGYLGFLHLPPAGAQPPQYFIYGGYHVEGFNVKSALLSTRDRCFKNSMFYFYAVGDTSIGAGDPDVGVVPGDLGFGYVNLGYQERRCGTNGLILTADNPFCPAVQ